MPKRQGQFQPRGAWINRVTKLAIILRDGSRCLVCLTPVSELKREDITLDHVLPRILGDKAIIRRMWRGTTKNFMDRPKSVNDSRNLYTCCRSCNSRRGYKAFSTWAGPEVYERVKAACLTPLPRKQAQAFFYNTIELTR